MGCRTCEENKIQVSGAPVLDDGTPEKHCDLACNSGTPSKDLHKTPASLILRPVVNEHG